jgi:O-antigen/teichoic acid export membrane protein
MDDSPPTQHLRSPVLRNGADRISYLRSGEPTGHAGGRESSPSAPPDGHFTRGDAVGPDSVRPQPAVDKSARRGYTAFAHTGEFPALPITLELPAIRAESDARRDRRLGVRSGNPLYRTAWALIVNTGGTTILGFVYWVVVAHLYDRQTLGRASALISALILLSSFTQLNLSNALPRFLPSAGRSSSRLIAYSYGVSSLAALPVAVGFVLLMPRLSAQWQFLTDSRLLELLFVLAALVWGVFALEDAALTGLRRAEVVPVENLVYGVIKLVAVICVAGVLPASGIFVSWTIPLFAIIPIVNVLIFSRYVPTGQVASDSFRVGQVVRFTSVDYLATLSTQAYGSVLPLMVLSVLGPAANGSFYIAWTISVGLGLVAGNFGMSLMVEAAAAPHRLVELTRGISARCALVTILGSVAVSAAARPILHIYGNTYANNAVSLLILLALGVIPRAAVIITWSLDRIAGRVGRAAVTQAALAVIVLAGSRYLIRGFGIDGIGYAWAAGNFVIAVVRLPTLVNALRPSPARRRATPAAGDPTLAVLIALTSVGGTRGRDRRGRHRAGGSRTSGGRTSQTSGPGPRSGLDDLPQSPS